MEGGLRLARSFLCLSMSSRWELILSCCLGTEGAHTCNSQCAVNFPSAQMPVCLLHELRIHFLFTPHMTQVAKFVFNLQLSQDGNLNKLSYKVENVWLSSLASWMVTGG